MRPSDRRTEPTFKKCIAISNPRRASLQPVPEFRRAAERLREIGANLEAQKIESAEHRLELKIEGLDRKITETNANTLKWVISAIGFQTLVLVGTIVGAVAALTRFIPAAPILHQ
nr:hypothetical protein [Methylosinus sp. Sm6]